MSKDMRISVRLKAGRDDEIIRWLEHVGSNDRSYYIREALRGFLNQGTSQARKISNNSNTNTIDSQSKSYDIKPEQNKNEKTISDFSEEELTKKMKGFAN